MEFLLWIGFGILAVLVVKYLIDKYALIKEKILAAFNTLLKGIKK